MPSGCASQDYVPIAWLFPTAPEGLTAAEHPPSTTWSLCSMPRPRDRACGHGTTSCPDVSTHSQGRFGTSNLWSSVLVDFERAPRSRCSPRRAKASGTQTRRCPLMLGRGSDRRQSEPHSTTAGVLAARLYICLSNCSAAIGHAPGARGMACPPAIVGLRGLAPSTHGHQSRLVLCDRLVSLRAPRTRRGNLLRSLTPMAAVTTLPEQ